MRGHAQTIDHVRLATAAASTIARPSLSGDRRPSTFDCLDELLVEFVEPALATDGDPHRSSGHMQRAVQ
jgi:hypothetical protein